MTLSAAEYLIKCAFSLFLTSVSCLLQARKALTDRQKELELKTQQLETKLSGKSEEEIKKARRKSTQAGQNRGRSGVSFSAWTSCSHEAVALRSDSDRSSVP